MKQTQTKQVIIVRKELNMPPGKLAAQVAHASMAFLTKRIDLENPVETFLESTNIYNINLKKQEQEWLNNSFIKIIVAVQTDKDLHILHEKALKNDIEAHFIVDDGRTLFNGVPTLTCLAIGPDESSKIDKITKGLPLL